MGDQKRALPHSSWAAAEASRPWLSSLLARTWQVLGSLLIYSIRRHKLDDYRGHYRWWLVAGIAWLVMSVDAITGLHDLFARP